METYTAYLGDSNSLEIPLTWQGAAFTPADDWTLIMTAKNRAEDLDTAAVFQKASGAGLSVTGSTATITTVPDDTNDLGDCNLVCDIQAQHLTTGELRTVAFFRVSFTRDVTRSADVSVPIYTTEEYVSRGETGATGPQGATGPTGPQGPALELTAGPVTSSAGTSAIADGAISLSKLAQSSATTGQVSTWNGSAWVAATTTSEIGALALPLTIPTPAGITTPGLSTHPSVVDVPAGIGGYRYWMAFTPYPTLSDENPCIVASNDKVTWVVPAGLTNPIEPYSSAVAKGHTAWSDTELVYDGTKFCCYFRGYKSGASDTIYRKTSTDGITWTSAAAVLTEAQNVLVSPTIVIEANGTWKMWTVNTGTGGIPYYTSADGITWTAYNVSNVCTGRILDPWHLQVKRYNGMYFMLLMTYSMELRMYYSYNGTRWLGGEKPFIVASGAAWDSGGYYRSCFLPKGGWPCKFDMWISGMEGAPGWATASSKPQRIAYSELTFDDLTKARQATDSCVVALNDHFIGGTNASAAGSLIGELGWNLYHGNGTGSVDIGLDSSDDTAIGLGQGVTLKSGATSGNISGIRMGTGTVGTRPFNMSRLQNFESFRLVWHFKLDGTTHKYYLGMGSDTLTTDPGRWFGLQSIPGQTYFEFRMKEPIVGTTFNTTIASTVARNTSWHRFEMMWDGPTGTWKMRIDGEPYISMTNKPDRNAAINVNIGAWAFAMANSAATIKISRFSLFGLDKGIGW